MGKAPARAAVHSEQVAGWAFAGPAMLLIVTFGLIPIVWSFVLSFQKSNLLAPDKPFVGLDNYHRLADDPLFRDSVVALGRLHARCSCRCPSAARC